MRGTLPLMGETTFRSNNLDVYVLGGLRPLRRRCLLKCCSCLTSVSTVQCGNRRNSLSDGGKCTTTRSLKCLCYESKIASPITGLLFRTTRWDKIAKINETHGAPSNQQHSVSFSLWAGKVIMGSFSLEKVSPERERDCLKIYSAQHWGNVHVMCMCRLDIKLSSTH